MPADPLAAAKARIAEIRAELLRLADELVDLEAFVEARERHLTLHPKPERSKIGSKMPVNNEELRRKRISAGRSTVGTASKAAAIAAGASDDMIAAYLKKGRSTVAAWHAGTRACPDKYKPRLREKFGIPEESWSKTTD